MIIEQKLKFNREIEVNVASKLMLKDGQPRMALAINVEYNPDIQQAVGGRNLDDSEALTLLTAAIFRALRDHKPIETTATVSD